MKEHTKAMRCQRLLLCLGKARHMRGHALGACIATLSKEPDQRRSITPRCVLASQAGDELRTGDVAITHIWVRNERDRNARIRRDIEPKRLLLRAQRTRN